MAIAVDVESRQKAFYQKVEKQAFRPLWLVDNPGAPRGDVRPWMWPWRILRSSMMEAQEVMGLGGEEGADRRVLTMCNPTMAPMPGPTRTLSCACQLVKPGEEAPSHRHSMAALRFIIEGDGGYTTVDGEPLSMEPGDFLLTPSWTWHGHWHEGSQDMLWLDVLDVPLVRSHDWQFYQEFAEPRKLQPPEKERDEGLRRFGTGSVLPNWMGRPNKPYSPLFSYKYKPTREALYRLTDFEPSPYEGYALTFSNPFTGGPVMPTIGAALHLLTSGQRTKARRATTSSIFHVSEGKGFSILDGQRFEWERGDTFCVPNWVWAEHSGETDAILFEASDLPVLQSLALFYKEDYQENEGHQRVTETFIPADA